MNANTQTIILAAGAGTRMNSNIPKVLHKLADKSLLQHVLDKAKEISPKISVIYGHLGAMVRKSISDKNISWVMQKEQKGTGHAVMQAMPNINDNDNVLILYGDVPLIKSTTLAKLIETLNIADICILSALLANPFNYGRILRDENNNVKAIVEHKDANREELKIKEINSGIMAIKAKYLNKYLVMLKSNNAKGEFYLTDIIGLAVKDELQVMSIISKDEYEIMGINDKKQLAELEKVYQLQKACQLAEQGLRINDLSRFDLRGTIKFGKDCKIDINVIIEGDVILADNVEIEANTIIRNSIIGNNSKILANSIVEMATIKENVTIGPFARIREGSVFNNNAKVGNFVETKKTTVGNGSKASHLSYLGDSTIGDNVNIGAGCITCNYDGVNKHQTIIEDNVFVGSDTQLIAPVTIHKNATIGAGSTISKNVAEDKLTITRAKQITVDNWKRPSKK